MRLKPTVLGQCKFECCFCLQIGDLQSSYNAASRAQEAFPEHTDSKELLRALQQQFSML